VQVVKVRGAQGEGDRAFALALLVRPLSGYRWDNGREWLRYEEALTAASRRWHGS
jgi:hypothetical protein